MKKTFLLAGLMACLVFGYAQEGQSTKYGRVENTSPEDLAKLKALIAAQKNQEAVKDCGDEHLGRVAFFNKSAKEIKLEVFSSGGKGETIKITIPAEQSVYVNDLLVGEYKFKKATDKKPKKKDFVAVAECMLKVVSIE